MPPSARQAYNDLIAEQTSLLAEAGRFEEEGAELSAALAAAEGELSRNGFKQRVLEVQVSAGAAQQPATSLALTWPPFEWSDTWQDAAAAFVCS